MLAEKRNNNKNICDQLKSKLIGLKIKFTNTINVVPMLHPPFVCRTFVTSPSTKVISYSKLGSQYEYSTSCPLILVSNFVKRNVTAPIINTIHKRFTSGISSICCLYSGQKMNATIPLPNTNCTAVIGVYTKYCTRKLIIFRFIYSSFVCFDMLNNCFGNAQ